MYASYSLVVAPVSRIVGGLVSRGRAAQRSRQEQRAVVEPTQRLNLAKDVSTDKRTKGLKQLLKESKQAAAAHSHENLPDSALYLNTLKGHGDSVVSVEISADNGSIITASEDKVRYACFHINTHVLSQPTRPQK